MLESYAAAGELASINKEDAHPEVTADVPAAAVGETFTVPVSIEGAAPLAGFTITLAYDKNEVVFKGVALGSGVSPDDYLMSSNDMTVKENGVVSFSVVKAEPTGKSASTELAVFTFTRTAVTSDTLPITLTSFVNNDVYGHAPRQTDPMAPIFKTDRVAIEEPVEGEGEAVEGEGEVVEGEGEVVEGEGEAVEGEGEVVEGEGEVVEGEGEGEPAEGEALTAEEIAQQLSDVFGDADSDDDGQLSLVEARALVPSLTEEQFAELDKNGDGFLSQRELDEFLGENVGCCRCNEDSKDAATMMRKLMADWLLVGLSMIALLAMTSRGKGSRG